MHGINVDCHREKIVNMVYVRVPIYGLQWSGGSHSDQMTI